MQKHPDDPAAVPSEPTVGDPDAGFDQELDSGKPRRGKERKETGRPRPPPHKPEGK